MRYLIFFITVFISSAADAQSGRQFYIADTLPSSETTARNIYLLQTEFDSILLANQPVATIPEKTDSFVLTGDIIYLLGGLLLILAIGVGYLIFRQIKMGRLVESLESQITGLSREKQRLEEIDSDAKRLAAKPPGKKALEQAAALRQTRENYDAIKAEFELIKGQMMQVFKLRNYPGFSKEKSETEILQAILQTEKKLATFAFEHYLKPALQITDANKNRPAGISEEDQHQLLDMLISLALFYTECLYLRIPELSVGGSIVSRLSGIYNGNKPDESQLRELSLEHGSRALSLRMTLDKAGIKTLSYPVFDETNLNIPE